ncbi:MAG TPA: oligosaccharide flippase family protein [Thermoanaerobaculia bacterium]|nr:oligosaccharide flippase family protein [Thermoanaerobaculia bacterium]
MGEPGALTPSPEPGAPSTEQRVLRSTLAGYSIQLARLLVTFGAKLLLARLILPEGHGLYELALRIVTIASAFRDLGLPYHLVRDARRPYGTVLAVTTFLGGLITVGLIVAAPATSVLTPELPAVLRVMAFWVLLDGLAVVPRAFFERELSIGRLIGPEVWRGVIIAAVSLSLAWLGWGVWSFVIADLAGALLLAVWSWSRTWGRIPLKPDLHLVPDLIRRSSWLFFIWVVIQLVTYVDIFIIEVFGNTEQVGLYSNSYRIAFLVATLVYPRALFPTLVEYLGDPPRFFDSFRLSTLQLLGFQVLGSYFLLFNAATSIRILLGEGWEGAVPMLQVIAFIPFFDQFTILGGEMLKARHEDRAWLWAVALNLVSLVVLGVIFTQRWGAVGMGAANYLLVGNLLMGWWIWRVFRSRFWTILADLAQLYLIPLPFFAAAAWLFPEGSWARFAASIGAAALATSALAARYHRVFRAFFGRRGQA